MVILCPISSSLNVIPISIFWLASPVNTGTHVTVLLVPYPQGGHHLILYFRCIRRKRESWWQETAVPCLAWLVQVYSNCFFEGGLSSTVHAALRMPFQGQKSLTRRSWVRVVLHTSRPNLSGTSMMLFGTGACLYGI
jgi:hypothetical protein